MNITLHININKGLISGNVMLEVDSFWSCEDFVDDLCDDKVTLPTKIPLHEVTGCIRKKRVSRSWSCTIKNYASKIAWSREVRRPKNVYSRRCWHIFISRQSRGGNVGENKREKGFLVICCWCSPIHHTNNNISSSNVDKARSIHEAERITIKNNKRIAFNNSILCLSLAKMFYFLRKRLKDLTIFVHTWRTVYAAQFPFGWFILEVSCLPSPLLYQLSCSAFISPVLSDDSRNIVSHHTIVYISSRQKRSN